MKKVLFIFRRDLRLQDNTGLMAALKEAKTVLPCFILDPRQVGEQPYKGERSVRFMIESLLDLERDLKSYGGRLYIFQGLPHEIIKKLIPLEKIDAVYLNRDYTPFSQHRDQDIESICNQAGIVFKSFHDAMLNAPETVRKNDGGVYTVFTPYWHKARVNLISKPVVNSSKNYHTSAIKMENRSLFESLVPKGVSHYPGGRAEALNILRNMKRFKAYAQQRNDPSLDATTKLSAHNKFGTCSIREVYHAMKEALGGASDLLRQLYWRDFFMSIGFHFPHVLGTSFHSKYDKLKWDNNPKLFQAWCEGRTGFPIVDAGMRELNTTGFMHNRVRMITASFLVKDLHIDWSWGEKYFAQRLIDYDPLVNNGSWQWVASTGCDAQPYFRIFNPWIQQEKFDPQALYIKKWVPELKGVNSLSLHQIVKKNLTFEGYPSPIVSHDFEKLKTLRIYGVL